MIRLSKLTDYGFVLLSQFACSDSEKWLTARDLADVTGLPLPTVSKLLKVFSKNGILAAQRGVYGGYRLAHEPRDVRVLNIIELMDGPIAITECGCATQETSQCAIHENCPTRPQWQKITERIRSALADITLLEMAGLQPVASRDTPCHGSCAPTQGQPCQCGHETLDTPGDRR